MPSYDYRCQGCDSNFTVERSMTASTETSCPQCQSEKVSRIWNMNFRTGGCKPDVGQGTTKSSSSSGGGCGSCSSHSCGSGSCH
ncbi:MAG TPA: zinc ribbon domain-containing protein [Candidatus Obscuribacter sp.]|nr:zinc ribbon domain-containing protein [Candidatus Obscuribacter sp.]